MSMALMLTVLLGVDSFAQTFEQANDAYARGAYEEAARGYEALIAESIEDPAVFFNLGNAYYKQWRLGCAIANYERALRLEPGMPDARDNLGQAVMKTAAEAGCADARDVGAELVLLALRYSVRHHTRARRHFVGVVLGIPRRAPVAQDPLSSRGDYRGGHTRRRVWRLNIGQGAPRAAGRRSG